MVRAIAVLALAACVAPLAHASAQRTFVASYGSDANTCTLTAPCRSFAVAIAQVASDGVVVVLDSAGYGPVNIANSVTIVAPAGVYAGISVGPTGAQDGVAIQPGAFDVTLRGLTISGSNGTPNGISAQHSGSLNIDACVIANTARGIDVPASGPLKLSIKDTVIRDTTAEGIRLSPLSGSVTGVIDGVHVERAGTNGLAVAANANLQVRDSVFDSNAAAGIRADTIAAGNAVLLTVTNSIVSGNAQGIFGSANQGAMTVTATTNTIAGNSLAGMSGNAAAGGIVKMVATHNTVTQNGSGFDGTGVTFDSLNDNTVHGNGVDLVGTINGFFWQ